jgi:type 1 glutamine amidotransferase
MKHYIALLVICAFFVAALQPVRSQDSAEKPIRVLIVEDQSPGYYPMPTATGLRNIIRQDKRFEVVLAEDAEVLGTDLPFDYDVILLHFKNYRTPKRDAAMKANLEKFVTAGGGLFVYHFACGAFEDWAGFEKLSGRIWDPKLPPHDPYGLFTVQISDKAHPVTKDLGNFEIRDELYTCLKESAVPIHVLAEAVSVVDKKTYPMAFVLENGKGRIFHTTLGHDDRSLSSAGFQTMIKNALAWCAKR